MLAVHDIDWFDFSHKHGFLIRLKAASPSRSQRVAIVLARLGLILAVFYCYWYNLEMIEKISPLALRLQILDKDARVNISF